MGIHIISWFALTLMVGFAIYLIWDLIKESKREKEENGISTTN